MLKLVQPREGDILEVSNEFPCMDMKVVSRGGAFWALKFTYANGAVLYVPLPADRIDQPDQQLDISLGPLTA